MKDHLGDELPPGYIPWMCNTCTAVCNFEAMMQCAPALAQHPEAPCGFDRDQPESNGGAFGFMIRGASSGGITDVRSSAEPIGQR